MKVICLATSLLISSFSFANSSNFGLIQDPDGFVNVRDQASTKSKVIAKLNNGEVVSIIDDYSENHFNYVFNNQLPDHTGYIHKSRINLFKGFQKWKLTQNTTLQASYTFGANKLTIITAKAQVNQQDFKFGASPQAFQRYKNKPFYGTDGVLPTDRLQFASIDILYQGQNIHIPAQVLENYFIPNTSFSKDGLQDFAQAKIYSKGQDLYFINILAGGGAAQYVLIIHIQNGKLVKIQAWNESI